MSKFEHDELERRLKEALAVALVDVAYDDELDVDVDGPFAILTQYSLDTNEPVAKFEVRFDIREVSR